MAETALKYISRTLNTITHKLARNGYSYSLRNTIKDRKYWYCTERNICNASLIEHAGVFLKGKKDWSDIDTHKNHEPHSDKFSVDVIRGKAKKLAIEQPLKPSSDIFDEVTQSEDKVFQAILPSEENFKKVIRRHRRHPYFFKDPRCRADLAIPEKSHSTLEGDKFLQFDSEDHKRNLLFTTKENIRRLSTCDTWSVDGTFKVCPRLYKKGQVYSIHGHFYLRDDEDNVIKSVSYPLAYAVLADKTEHSYKMLFNDLKAVDTEITLKPKFIIVDYLKAQINALVTAFPKAKIRGCLFHLAHSVQRKVQELSLQRMYSTNAAVRLQVKQMYALAFVPVTDVRKRFMEMYKRIIPCLQPLALYFHTVYIGTIRNPAQYDLAFWNIRDRIYKDVPRSNNAQEGWHHRFHLKMGCDNPLLWKFIFILGNEQQHTQNSLIRIDNGTFPYRQRKKYATLNSRLKKIVRNYGKKSMPIKKFLRIIVNHLK